MEEKYSNRDKVGPYGNTDTHYQGTVTFSSSDTDPGVILPADYNVQAADAGMAVFPGGVTLMTPGDQTLTVTDIDSGITGGATVTVTDGGRPGNSPGRGAKDGLTAAGRDRSALDDWFAAPAEKRYGRRAWFPFAEAASVHRRLAVGLIEAAPVDDEDGLSFAWTLGGSERLPHQFGISLE